MAEYLDQLDFDMILDLHGNFRSKFLSRYIAAGVKAQYPKRRWERFLAVRFKRIKPDPPHTIDLYNEAVKKCGGLVVADRPILHFSEQNNPRLEFNDAKPVVAVGPGASYPPKQWPTERFDDLIKRLIMDLGANVIVLLTSRDRPPRDLERNIPSGKLKILIDEPLENLGPIMSQCRLTISNDSALAHISSSVGTPVIALFGPTHPVLGFAPRGLNDIIMQVDEPCRPCSLHGKRACYRDRQYCFQRIEVDQVLAEVNSKLEINAKGDKALFIDRDGSLIVDKDYLFDPELVEPEPGSIEAVQLARTAGYKIVVVSNQSGVARGYFGEDDVRSVDEKVSRLFAEAGAEIDRLYYCPHYIKGARKEYAVECRCRKPSPGMIETAVQDLHINPFQSYVIGDKPSDVQLAYVTGACGILVRTGYGQKSEREIEAGGMPNPKYIADNLLAAVKYVIASEGKT
jgi:D,D-heptose 1,7-bisphosphate phosphatase